MHRKVWSCLSFEDGWHENRAGIAQVGRALQSCESLTLSEDKKRVRRTVPLTSAEDAIAQIDQRSLYASPFPFKTTLDAITEFFQKRAPVNCVRMRRHMESKDFRGSVFVEFADEAAAQKVHCLPSIHVTASFLVLHLTSAILSDDHSLRSHGDYKMLSLVVQWANDARSTSSTCKGRHSSWVAISPFSFAACFLSRC